VEDKKLPLITVNRTAVLKSLETYTLAPIDNLKLIE
jgi:hypothetical protein